MPNRLISEKSPYLLQHAHNPVDWRPWGDEAFDEACRRDVPVFLSIGYSSCHWCHVMERECFEDKEVAGALNAGFVSVKVDREERPDVDHLYMEACAAMTGGGGWPLSCFLDHDRRPFFAGTYFPKPGFLSVLERIGGLWNTDRKKITAAAESVIGYMHSALHAERGKLEGGACAAAYEELVRSFDARYGGFGAAPKFPSAHTLMFLLYYGLLHGGSRAHDMARKTLDAMAAGGLFDHVGGGFCRYSTDERWLAPHFEKMLYGNAMLAMAYTEASAAFGEPAYAAVAERVFEYVFREMTGPHGEFYTAQDADSEGEEGKWCLWTPGEVREALGEADGGRFCGLFDITEKGNFEGKNIPNLIGKRLSDEDRAFAGSCFSRLLAARDKRPQPFRDDKALASSNGLMIAALALAARLLHKPDYAERAEKAARFLLDHLARSGRLQSSWREGRAAGPATSDDYAYLVWGLFELFQATYDPEWLRLALQWTDGMLRLFWDDENGGLYLAGADVSGLPLRPKNLQDGALPSGNSVAALNLIRLARATGREEYEEKAAAILDALAPAAGAWPSGATALLSARLYLESLGSEVVVANGKGLEAMLAPTQAFLPFTVVSVRGRGYEAMDGLTVNREAMEAQFDAATAYLCSKGACKQPVTEPNQLAGEIKKLYQA
jgi:uncharacterized protein YyaL (SSP411 family)